MKLIWLNGNVKPRGQRRPFSSVGNLSRSLARNNTTHLYIRLIHPDSTLILCTTSVAPSSLPLWEELFLTTSHSSKSDQRNHSSSQRGSLDIPFTRFFAESRWCTSQKYRNTYCSTSRKERLLVSMQLWSIETSNQPCTVCRANQTDTRTLKTCESSNRPCFRLFRQMFAQRKERDLAQERMPKNQSVKSSSEGCDVDSFSRSARRFSRYML